MKTRFYFLLLVGLTSTLLGSYALAAKKATVSTPTNQAISIAYLTQLQTQPTQMLSNLDLFINEKGSI